MSWYVAVAYFFGGAFATNACPHLIAGVSGRPLQTPFASPPFRGLSPPTVNVAWGLFNLAVGYVLLLHVGEFDVRSWPHAALAFAGVALQAFNCARSLHKLNQRS